MRDDGSAVAAPVQSVFVRVSYQLTLPEGAPGMMGTMPAAPPTPVLVAPAVPAPMPALPDVLADPGPPVMAPAVHATDEPTSIANEQATPNGRTQRGRTGLDFMFTSSTGADRNGSAPAVMKMLVVVDVARDAPKSAAMHRGTGRRSSHSRNASRRNALTD